MKSGKSFGGFKIESMKPVYILSDNIINSLGFSTEEVFSAVKSGISGIRITDDRNITPVPIPLSRVDDVKLDKKFNEIAAGKNGAYTRMEKMFILSIHDALSRCGSDFSGTNTLLIISTTKGNIDLLEMANKDRFPDDRVKLWSMAGVIAGFFGFANRPMVVSNACISGVLALNTGYRYIRNGNFENVIVAGGDMVTEFVVSGFLSFQALSPEPCKPFDLNRTGLSIGEGCGTMVLSSAPGNNDGARITVAGSAVTNDANHISGPSRTGEELGLAMKQAMAEAGIAPHEVDYISAHGTATPYNDEMESKAISFAGLSLVPVNSYKGYWGHTLGAAGVIESVMTAQCMRSQTLVQSIGFSEAGTPEPLNVIRETVAGLIRNSVKIASGFGGCNGAIIFRRS